MKDITSHGEYTVDGKKLIIVSDHYIGKPLICYQYDILVGSRQVIKKYFHDLVPQHLLKQGWKPIIKYI